MFLLMIRVQARKASSAWGSVAYIRSRKLKFIAIFQRFIQDLGFGVTLLQSDTPFTSGPLD